MATVTRERELLRELVALVRGECPSLLNEDSGGDVRLSMAIDDALASPPAEDEATELREALKAQTSRADVMDRAGAYQAMELRKAHKQCRLLRAEIERLKAQAPPASEALIERLTDAVARLPERHELGDVRDAIAAALAAQAPPASDPPGLVALVDKHIDGLRRAYSLDGIDAAMREMGKIRIEALECFRDTLPLASPQAETKGDE